MKLGLISLILFCQMMFNDFYQEQEETATIEVTVENIKSTEGQIAICLIGKSEDFLKRCFEHKLIPIQNEGSLKMEFQDVPFGRYAISMYHDKNKDEEINTNLLGIPKEPFGFSNNPKLRLRAPNFEECNFEVNQSKMQKTIKLTSVF